MPSGWGEPMFDRLEADLAKAMFSLPASKGFDIGSGLDGIPMTGCKHNGPGRHEPCVLPRAVPLVESMTTLVLMDYALRQHVLVPDSSCEPPRTPSPT